MPGDTRWYFFGLEENSNHCTISAANNCSIGGVTTISLSTEKAHILIKADGVDCYEIIEDTRSYDRVVEVTTDLSLATGFESGAIYYGKPADGGSVTITIANFDPSHIGDYAKFVKKTGENATFRIVSVDQTFDEVINNNNRGFTLSVAPDGYTLSQDSRPVASNVRVTFFPTDNVSIFEPTYAGVLETVTQPEEILTSAAIISSDQANPTSLGYWIDDYKVLIGLLQETSIIANAVIKLSAAYNRTAKIRFRYYEYDFGTNTLNPTPLSTTSYSASITDPITFQEFAVSGTLPTNTWAKGDGSSNKLLVIELQAFKSGAAGDNPTLDFVSGGENSSSTYIDTPFANINHNTLGGVVKAGVGVPDGHIDSKYPIQFPVLTSTERDALTGVISGLKFYNSTIERYQFSSGSVWFSELTSTQIASILDHITGTGEDHSYIDQDLTTTGKPIFAGIAVGRPALPPTAFFATGGETVGDGQVDLYLSAQDASVGSGGSVVISAGTGPSGDGIVDIIGAILSLQGEVTVKGPDNTSATYPLKIQDVNGTDLLAVRGDGVVEIPREKSYSVNHLGTIFQLVGVNSSNQTVFGPLTSNTTTKIILAGATGPIKLVANSQDVEFNNGSLQSNNGRIDGSGSLFTKGGHYRNVTAVNTTTYTVLSSDYTVSVSNTGAAETITLPSLSSAWDATTDTGQVVIVKDSAGDAGTYTITINVDDSGTETIDGGTSVTITSNYGFVRLQAISATKWIVC